MNYYESVTINIGTKPSAGGVHIRRTIMLKELTKIMEASGTGLQPPERYKEQVVQQNLLGLSTQSNRDITWTNLANLYGFNNTPVFRNFHRLWLRSSENHRNSLAVVIALSRDSIFMTSSQWISPEPLGSVTGSNLFLAGILKDYSGRYSTNSAASMSRNLVSSWKQAGWIDGKTIKRQSAVVGPAALAMAYFIAWAGELRGDQLSEAPISKVLLREVPEPKALLWEAHRNGFLNYLDAGGISDIRFPGWLTKEEEELLHGTV